MSGGEICIRTSIEPYSVVTPGFRLCQGYLSGIDRTFLPHVRVPEVKRLTNCGENCQSEEDRNLTDQRGRHALLWRHLRPAINLHVGEEDFRGIFWKIWLDLERSDDRSTGFFGSHNNAKLFCFGISYYLGANGFVS
jgi:hypothetical protein